MARVKAKVILVMTRDECQGLKERIDAGADFAKLAKQHSKCTTARDGGYLGNFHPGQMIKEIDAVAFNEKAEVGKTHGPIETPKGFFLLHILEREDGG